MAMGAAWKCRRVIENVTHILAIELMCSAQAVDCRAPLAPGRGVAWAHQRVRELVPPLERDRVLSTDIAEIAAAVRRGTFAQSFTESVV
jgi:histidine ammonia-lyase